MCSNHKQTSGDNHAICLRSGTKGSTYTFTKFSLVGEDERFDDAKRKIGEGSVHG